MTAPQTLHALVNAARTPLSDWTARYPEHRPMGYLCSYVPEELVHAAGYTPVRLRATAASLRHADAHLQSFTCALCRSTLDQVLGGNLEVLIGTIFAHTCDAMQALADLWRMNTGIDHFVDTVMQPANLGTPAARAYLAAELHRFRKRLAALSGRPIDDGNLRATIALYDETRRLVGSLQLLRDRLCAADFYAVLDAAEAMPREAFNPLLTQLLSELEGAPAQAASPRLFLVGAILDEPRLLELIDVLGAQVVGDDLCSGSRHFHDQVGASGDLIGNLTDYYLRRPPCPTKFHPDHDPGRYLLDQVRRDGAAGVVFAIEKFCEPHAFDYALTRQTLEQAGVPHLLLEMEQSPSIEALRTRLQAFIEML